MTAPFISTPATPVVSPVGTSADPDGVLSADTGVYLVGLLASKQYDPNAVVWGKASLGQMRGDRVKNAIRPDGSVGVHYPTLWLLTEGEGSQLADWMKTLPLVAGKKEPVHPAIRRQVQASTPSASRSDYRPQAAQAAPAASSQFEARFARLEAMVGQLADHITAPAPAEGFTQVTDDITALVPGQPVHINGVIRYVSDDGKRLNLTPSS